MKNRSEAFVEAAIDRQLCPECGGLGLEFSPVNQYNQRVQRDCPVCGGSGKLEDSLSRTLAGDNERILPIERLTRSQRP